MCRLGTWFNGRLGSAKFPLDPMILKGLFQLKQLYDSVTPKEKYLQHLRDCKSGPGSVFKFMGCKPKDISSMKCILIKVKVALLALYECY